MRATFYLEFDSTGRTNLTKIVKQLSPYLDAAIFPPTTRLKIATVETTTDFLPVLNNIFDNIKTRDFAISAQSLSAVKTDDLIFAKFKVSKELLQIQSCLTAKLSEKFNDFAPPKFYPHLTLAANARFKMPFLEIKKNIEIYNLPFVATLKFVATK